MQGVLIVRQASVTKYENHEICRRMIFNSTSMLSGDISVKFAPGKIPANLAFITTTHVGSDALIF